MPFTLLCADVHTFLVIILVNTAGPDSAAGVGGVGELLLPRKEEGSAPTRLQGRGEREETKECEAKGGDETRQADGRRGAGANEREQRRVSEPAQ